MMSQFSLLAVSVCISFDFDLGIFTCNVLVMK
jgi:hypothetical protein